MRKGKTDGYGNPIASVDELDVMLGVLPPIRGAYFFADKYEGLAANDGQSPGSAKAEFADALDLCTSGDGDGVVLMSGGTTLDTTASRLSAVKTWSKHGVYLRGLSAGGEFNRATIRNAAAVTNLANLVTISGNNNVIDNVGFVNEGSDAAALGAVKVTGARNYFKDCHFVGACHATPAADAGAYDVMLDAAEEITFERCVFGTDSIIRAAANGNVLIDGGCWRIKFIDCVFRSYSATSGKGHIKIADATAFSGQILFKGCTFMNWNENELDAVAACVIGTKPNSGQLLFDDCAFLGFTAVGGAGMSGCVYVANSAVVASGAGGIATTM